MIARTPCMVRRAWIQFGSILSRRVPLNPSFTTRRRRVLYPPDRGEICTVSEGGERRPFALCGFNREQTPLGAPEYAETTWFRSGHGEARHIAPAVCPPIAGAPAAKANSSVVTPLSERSEIGPRRVDCWSEPVRGSFWHGCRK